MNNKWKSADQLVTFSPGAFARRREIILALCAGGVYPISIDQRKDPDQYAGFLVRVANRIIERTEQSSQKPKPKPRAKSSGKM